MLGDDIHQGSSHNSRRGPQASTALLRVTQALRSTYVCTMELQAMQWMWDRTSIVCEGGVIAERAAARCLQDGSLISRRVNQAPALCQHPPIRRIGAAWAAE